jgi:hypothetical protein
MNKRRRWKAKAKRLAQKRHCHVCGEPGDGNENLVGGRVMCDYCHAETIAAVPFK